MINVIDFVKGVYNFYYVLCSYFYQFKLYLLIIK